MNLPSYHELCYTVAQIVSTEIAGGSLSGDELNKIADSLEQEFRQAYVEANSPYGEEDEGIVRYILENLMIEIEE